MATRQLKAIGGYFDGRLLDIPMDDKKIVINQLLYDEMPSISESTCEFPSPDIQTKAHTYHVAKLGCQEYLVHELTLRDFLMQVQAPIC